MDISGFARLASVVGLWLALCGGQGFTAHSHKLIAPSNLARERVPLSSASPTVYLRNGGRLPTAYAGSPTVLEAWHHRRVIPLSLASGDLDEDGLADLIVGYGESHGGFLAVYRAHPHLLAARGVDLSPGGDHLRSTGRDVQPFRTPARLVELPEAPQWLVTGDFDADGHLDVIAAATGDEHLYWLSGDGTGRLASPRPWTLPGTVEALAAGDINRRDGIPDLVVGIESLDGWEALIFPSSEGASHNLSETVRLPGPSVAMTIARLDDDEFGDLAVVGRDEDSGESYLVIVHGREQQRLSGEAGALASPIVIDRLSFPFTLMSMATGHFLDDGSASSQLALLADEGSVLIVSRDESRPQGWRTDILAGDIPSGMTRLVAASISGLPTDDLVLTDERHQQLHLLIGSTVAWEGGDVSRVSSFPRGRAPTFFPLAAPPVTALPMRLNADALSDLVVLTDDAPAPTIVLTQPVATFTVDSMGDGSDVNLNDGLCDDGTGHCTLRAAIEQANANPGPDLIAFALPEAGIPTIRPHRALPPITDPVTIDGTTQPAGRVELDGSAAGAAVDGLRIVAGRSVIRGLVVHHFDDDGIELASGGGNIIEGNFIGVDASGTKASGNSFTGIHVIDSANNMVGGTAPDAGNVISGNRFRGIELAGPNARNNRIQGNLIGTDATGTSVVGNLFAGVFVNGAPGNIIGGTTAGARNLISGNWDGVRVVGARATGNLIQGNLIGTAIRGHRVLGNAGDGVCIADAPGSMIGGASPRARNIIAGNNARGVFITGRRAQGNVIQGNFIGTDRTGTRTLPNATGVLINESSQNVVGGDQPEARNVISGNGDGIRIIGPGATQNLIEGNFIGTDATGRSVLGNSQDGVIIDRAPGNTIRQNVISGNNARGVFLFGREAANNLIEENLIGTDVTGTIGLSNLFHGVFINNAPRNVVHKNVISSNNLIGVLIYGPQANWNRVGENLIGIDATQSEAMGNAVGIFIAESASHNVIGAANVIAFNSGDGVFIESGTGNTVTSNSIFANAGLGINLGADRATPNDDMAGREDADAGANNLQNFPVLHEIVAENDLLRIAYSITSTPKNSHYPIKVEFFKADPSGQGQQYLGADIYTSADRMDGGIKRVSFRLGSAMRTGDWIVATATDRDGNTSEFCPPVKVQSP
ncbi:MAG: hypothetical protein D6723_15655 [Acidobacteria bacterium]|nr:MAG: hypothetical protein D6723_15655 [Acidobacteriota bacterium]